MAVMIFCPAPLVISTISRTNSKPETLEPFLRVGRGTVNGGREPPAARGGPVIAAGRYVGPPGRLGAGAYPGADG